jgi:hypothetical protein
MKNKNNKLLKDFIKYYDKHPQERFWQALRNWSGVPFLMVSKDGKFEYNDLLDTFYFKGKDK